MHCILKGISQLHACEALQLTKVLAAAALDVVPAFDHHPITKALIFLLLLQPKQPI
jgi:hypothetical protein